MIKPDPDIYNTSDRGWVRQIACKFYMAMGFDGFPALCYLVISCSQRPQVSFSLLQDISAYQMKHNAVTHEQYMNHLRELCQGINNMRLCERCC